MKKKINNKNLHDKLNDLINEYPEYLELDDEINEKRILYYLLKGDVVRAFYNNKQGEQIEMTKTQFKDFVLLRILTYVSSLDDLVEFLPEIKRIWRRDQIMLNNKDITPF